MKAIHVSQKPNEKRDYYALTESTRKKLEKRPTKYHDKPYEYLLKLERKELQRQKLERWPKTNWVWMAVIAGAIAFVFAILRDKFLSTNQPQPKKEPTEQLSDKRKIDSALDK